MDIHLVFEKYRMCCAAFVQRFADDRRRRHFVFMRVTYLQSWRSPAPHSPGRWQPEANRTGMRLTFCYLIEIDISNPELLQEY